MAGPRKYTAKEALEDIVGGGLSNLESLARGSVAGLTGFPGDINELLRDVAGFNPFPNLPALPTSEEILSAVPRVTKPRKESSGFETLGAFVQPTPAAVSSATKAVKFGAKAVAPTVAEMAAEMMARGEEAGFVVPTKLSAVKPARMSKAETEAAGLWHPISEIKMKKPVAAVQTKVVENPAVKMVGRKVISPEQMQGGVAIPLVGDRSATGRILKELEGTSMDIPLEGGPDFMRANPGMAWASAKGRLTPIAKKIRLGLESSDDIYGIYTTMGPQSVDFNTMVTEAILKQLDPSVLRKKDIKEFNQAVKAVKGQSGLKAPNFPGIEHPELERLLMEGSGGQRDAFIKTMAKAQFQKLGLPDVVSARVAVTDPELIDVPIGTSGYTIARMDPSAKIFEGSGHKTYPFDLAGDYVGGFSQMIPADVMFHTHMDARKMLGATPAKNQKSLESVLPVQYLDQEWLDRVMRHLEDVEKVRGEGLAGGGQPEEVKILERNAMPIEEKAAGGRISGGLGKIGGRMSMRKPIDLEMDYKLRKFAGGGEIRMADGGATPVDFLTASDLSSLVVPFNATALDTERERIMSQYGLTPQQLFYAYNGVYGPGFSGLSKEVGDQIAQSLWKAAGYTPQQINSNPSLRANLATAVSTGAQEMANNLAYQFGDMRSGYLSALAAAKTPQQIMAELKAYAAGTGSAPIAPIGISQDAWQRNWLDRVKANPDSLNYLKIERTPEQQAALDFFAWQRGKDLVSQLGMLSPNIAPIQLPTLSNATMQLLGLQRDAQGDYRSLSGDAFDTGQQWFKNLLGTSLLVQDPNLRPVNYTAPIATPAPTPVPTLAPTPAPTPVPTAAPLEQQPIRTVKDISATTPFAVRPNIPASPAPDVNIPDLNLGMLSRALGNVPMKNGGKVDPFVAMFVNDEKKYGLAGGGQPEKQDDGLLAQLSALGQDLKRMMSLGTEDIESYAKARPKELGLTGELGGQDDAMRHLLLARELRNRYPVIADSMLNIHEYFPVGLLQSREERKMDFANNALAAELAKKAKSKEEFERAAMDAIRSGRATVMKTKPKQYFAAGGLIGEHNITPDTEDAGRIINVDNPILE